VASGRGVAARAVAVLEAVAELAESQDVAEPCGARAQRHPRARVLVRLVAAACWLLSHPCLGVHTRSRKIAPILFLSLFSISSAERASSSTGGQARAPSQPLRR